MNSGVDLARAKGEVYRCLATAFFYPEKEILQDSFISSLRKALHSLGINTLLMFTVGIIVMFLSAVVYELFPDRRK